MSAILSRPQWVQHSIDNNLTIVLYGLVLLGNEPLDTRINVDQGYWYVSTTPLEGNALT